MVYDIDFKTGKIRWERELHKGVPPLLRHIKNSYASETPVTDGERVYVYFGSIGLVAALDMQGQRRLDEGPSSAFNTRRSSAPARRRLLYKDRLCTSSTTTRSSRS